MSFRKPLNGRRCAPASQVLFDALESRTLYSVPAAPSAPKSSVVSSGTQLQLNWKDNSANESGFIVFVGSSREHMAEIARVGANVTSFKQTPPEKGVTYFAQVRAFNADGVSAGTEVVPGIIPVNAPPPPRPTPKMPAAPTSLVASVVSSNTKIQLKWSDKSSIEKGFSIFRGTSRTNLVKVGSVGANVTTYTETPPAKNTAYYYNVRAFNGDGSSPATAIVSAKITSTSTPPPTPKPEPTPPPVPKPPPPPPEEGNVIHIGAGRAIKTLNSAPWPAKGQTARFVLDPGSYSVKLHFIQGNLTIESASTSNRAVINLPDVFDNDGNANNPTLSVVGSLTIRNIKTSGGGDTILLGSSPSGKIVAENIQMDAGAIWRGSGARSAFFKDNEVLGRPRANVYSSYGGRVGTCVIDHSGTNVPVRQGGRLVNGNPVGETAIRIMNVDNLTLKGIKTVPWFYRPGKEWKQDVQLRPRSGTIKVIDCDFYQPDVGDMLWREPAQPIQHVEFINCRFVKQPNVTTGVKSITFVNCRVGTTTLSKTVTYS